jgi:hypothetical protein
VLDGIKHTQFGIPQYYKDSSKIFYGNSNNHRTKSVIGHNNGSKLPRIRSTSNDSSKKESPRNRKKRTYKDIVIKNNIITQAEIKNKSALLKY